MSINKKLSGIGEIYYINLDSNPERKEFMENQFLKYEIKNYTRVSGFDARKEGVEDILLGSRPDKMSDAEIGCTISHLKAINYWYNNSDSEYAVIMEDDLMFDLVEHWNFTWDEFFQEIPYDWDVVQLSIITIDRLYPMLHKRFINDFSTACYIINRNYAKKLIELHVHGDKYKIDLGSKPRAVSDDLIYNAGNTYSIPILLANLHLESSIHQNHLDSYHKLSYYCIEFFWKNLSKNYTIKNLMNYDAELLHYWQILRIGSDEKNNEVISELEKIYHIDSFYKKYLTKEKNNK
jgi:GR25 family glycosyltransferase involved in LPS biosynthesis